MWVSNIGCNKLLEWASFLLMFGLVSLKHRCVTKKNGHTRPIYLDLTWIWESLTTCSLHRGDWTRREGITAHEHTSHPSNFENSAPYRFVADLSQLTWTRPILNLQNKSNVELTSKENNVQIAYYSKALMLDEREIRSYTTTPSLQNWTHNIIEIHNNALWNWQ